MKNDGSDRDKLAARLMGICKELGSAERHDSTDVHEKYYDRFRQEVLNFISDSGNFTQKELVKQKELLGFFEKEPIIDAKSGNVLSVIFNELVNATETERHGVITRITDAFLKLFDVDREKLREQRVMDVARTSVNNIL